MEAGRPEVKKLTGIEQEIHLLARQIEAVEKLRCQFSERLGSLLDVEQPERDKSAEAESAPRCKLGERLRNLTESLTVTYASLKDILERLQL